MEEKEEEEKSCMSTAARCSATIFRSSGTNVADDDNDDDGDMDELEEARFSAEMIQEAYANIKQPGKLSAYERRVALREVKEIIQQLLLETDSDVSSPSVAGFLSVDENEKTEEQFLVLREEMLRLMKRCDELESKIVGLCKKIRLAWVQLCGGTQRHPRDMLEVKILRKPKSLNPSPVTVSVLSSMLAVLEDAVSTGGGEDNSSPNKRKALEDEELREAKLDVLDVLAACLITDGDERERIFASFCCRTACDTRLMHARLISTLAFLQGLQRRVADMPTPPMLLHPLWACKTDDPFEQDLKKITEGVDSSQPEDAGRLSAMRCAMQPTERWIAEGRAVLLKCQAWELLSSVPFHCPAGAQMFLRRCWAPGATAVTGLCYTDLLSKVLHRLEGGHMNT